MKNEILDDGIILSRNIKLLLEKHGMTSMDIARRVEVSPSMLGLILKNKTKPTITTVAKIASAFNVAPWYLMCPHFNPDVDSVQLGAIIELISSNISPEARAAILAFAEYQAR